METVNFFSSLSDNQPKAVSWETVATEIRGDRFADLCRQYRGVLALCDEAEQTGDQVRADKLKAQLKGLKNQCAAIIPQVRLEGGRAADCVTGYERYQIVDIDHVPPERMAEAEGLVKADAHTRLAYVTISGRGLRVIAEVQGEVTFENFHDAWRTVNEYYKQLTGLPYDTHCSNNTRMAALSCDPRAVYNSKPKRMRIVRQKTVRRKTGPAPKPEKAGKTARWLVENGGIEYESGQHNDYVSRCVYWMNRFGVEAQKTEEWATEEFKDYNTSHSGIVPSIVTSIYRTYAKEHNTCRPSAFSPDAQRAKRAAIPEIEAWLDGKYKFRRNDISHTVECLKGDAKAYRALDDAAENSLWCELNRNGLNVDMQSLHTLLQSDYVEAYNPLRVYLDSLPAWDGKDYIGQFLAMVHCRDVSVKTFDSYARRWLVGMVAGVLDDQVVNHLIFVLLGAQGTFKTSFMNNILPPELRQYYCIKTNSNRMTKDDAFSLTENILINMEEIDSMQRSEINQLKAMASQPVVKERPAYGRSKVSLPHIASFCATGNNLQFLTDDTGSRRWLVFEVDHIDNPWEADINYSGIYSQIKHLLDTGFRYWFNISEIQQLNQRNRQYETPNLARELILTRYRRPLDMEQPVYLTASDIVARFGGAVRLNTVQVGMALLQLGFEQIRTHDGRFWKMFERPANEIGKVIPGMKSDPQTDIPF